MKRRKTQSKVEILDILRESGTALSHEMIKERISSPINRATIYRVLNSYCDDGRLHKVVGDDGKQYFAICQNNCEDTKQQAHLHFRCFKCEEVECLDQKVSFALPDGYQGEINNFMVTGLCDHCAVQETSSLLPRQD